MHALINFFALNLESLRGVKIVGEKLFSINGALPQLLEWEEYGFRVQAHSQEMQDRQRLQQMHQQLTAGQQQLKELQKAPEQNQQKVRAVLAHDCS